MKFKFKKKLGPVYNEEFWYDLTDGGYIKPKDLLEDQKQIDKLQQAIDLVKDFEDQVPWDDSSSLLEDM